MMYDRNKAISYLKKAADLGSGVACNMLGDWLSGIEIFDCDTAQERADCLEELYDIFYFHKDEYDEPLYDEYDKDQIEEMYWEALVNNDLYKVDFDLAKQYYELGAKLGNEICKIRLKNYDKRVKRTQTLIARSIPENSITGEFLEDEEIEALFEWFKANLQ